jgi:hypothetical protein
MLTLYTIAIKLITTQGGVAEWTIALVLKTNVRVSVPWVRILLPPPQSKSSVFRLAQRQMASELDPDDPINKYIGVFRI